MIRTWKKVAREILDYYHLALHDPETVGERCADYPCDLHDFPLPRWSPFWKRKPRLLP